MGGFSRDETAQHVHSSWPSAPNPWIDDFHFHWHGNPRVQRYALQQNCGSPAEALGPCCPAVEDLNDVSQTQSDEAAQESRAEMNPSMASPLAQRLAPPCACRRGRSHSVAHR